MKTRVYFKGHEASRLDVYAVSLRIFAEAEGDWTSPSMEMLVVAAAELGGIFLAWFLLLLGFRDGSAQSFERP